MVRHFIAFLERQDIQQFLTIFPSEAERAHVSHSQTGDHPRNYGSIRFIEFIIYQGALRPIHQLGQCDLVVKVSGNFGRHGVFRNGRIQTAN